MPELPEVEVMRSYFEEAAGNLQISDVEFLDPLNKVYKSPKPEISKNLVGQHFISTQRIGKYLFAGLSNGKWLHLHFGMTGSLQVYTDDYSLPQYTRMAIHFEDGSRLAFIDSRKFGRVEIIHSLDDYRDKGTLGIDLLEIKPDDFVKALVHRKIPIKAALLEQKHFAGIGNWIADEMLFETGIHPEEPCYKLSEKELKALLSSAVAIVKVAIRKDTHYGDFPEDFFVNYRKKGAVHPNHPHSKVESMRVGGRGTFIVPEKQKLKK